MTQVAISAIEKAIALIDAINLTGTWPAGADLPMARADLQAGLTELVGNGRPVLSEIQMFAKLEAFITECGTAKEAAARLGIGAGYLCDIRNSRKRAPDRVIHALGYQRRGVKRVYEQRGDL